MKVVSVGTPTAWQLIRRTINLELREFSEDGSQQNTVAQQRTAGRVERYRDYEGVSRIVNIEMGKEYHYTDLQFESGGKTGILWPPIQRNGDGDEILWKRIGDSFDPSPPKSGFMRIVETWVLFSAWETIPAVP